MIEYTEEEKNLIILSSFEELTYSAKQSVLSALESFTHDFKQSEKFPIKSCRDGVYNKVKDSFYDPSYRERIFSQLDERGVECVTLASSDYPLLLKQIDTPPLTLFVKGKRELLNGKLFSVVGSRRTSVFAIEKCKMFASELSQCFTIVTGCAYGADTAALEGAKEGAISVLAFGFDYAGKVSNAHIIQNTVETGLAISEYFPTVAPQKHYFPVRNRIIAGISEGTLIVSAGMKSGALITADYATDYGRDVFAFPYNLGVSSGEGCNNLIKKGANLVQNPLDIISFYGLDFKPPGRKSLSGDESRIYQMIKDAGEAFVPALAENLGVPPYKLIPVLSSLEIKGLVVRLGGNRYAAV